MPRKPASQKKDVARKPWMQWPRSSDVREWMNCLLRLAEFMDSAEERVSSTVICAIGELATMGFANEALEWVERIHDLLAPGDANKRSRILIKGAEIAFDAGNLQRMEQYLKRVLELQPLFTRKCDKGCQEHQVRSFRCDRGLLAPSDATSEEERNEASFRQAMRAASLAMDQGDAAGSIARLAEAEGFIATMPASGQFWARERIVVALARAGDKKNLHRLLDLDSSSDQIRHISPRTLLAIGERERAIVRWEEEVKEALAKLKAGDVNAHFPAMSLERAIRGLADAAEIKLAEKWLSRALEEGRSWYLVAPGAFSSAVFSSMAKAVARVQGREAALALVQLAMETAHADRKSNWRTEAIRANAELFIELSPPEEAVQIAGKLRSRSSKSRLLAETYARSEDWDNLHANLDACAKPSDAAELIWWTKFVWRPAN